MDTSLIKSKYLQHDKALQQSLSKIGKAKIPVVFPISHEVLSDFSNRVNKIFNAIISLASNNNLYCLFILYRSLLEHSYKAFYIFAKLTSELNDNTAEAYQKHLFIAEFLAEQSGILEMEDLINENSKKTDFLTFLITKFPELKGVDKKNQAEISAAINQFRLSEVVKFLHERFSKRNKNKAMAHLFAQTLPEYSHVSTFTHGGAYASKIIEKFSTEDLVQKEIDRIVKISLTLCCITKENVLSTYHPNAKIPLEITILQEIRKP